jgi:hypothetical protein
LESVGAAVELGVAEHGLDHRFAFAVKTAAEVGLEDSRTAMMPRGRP